MAAVSDTDFTALLSCLDARQRAMLQEMGVRVWWPQKPPDALVGVVGEEPTLAAQAMAPRTVPAATGRQQKPTGTISGMNLPHSQQASGKDAAAREDVARQALPVLDAALDLDGLRTAAVSCQACRLCAGRQHSVWEASLSALPQGLPRWLFVLDAPGSEENATGWPAQGDAGRLLSNMAAAIRLQPAQIYRAHATKCAPAPGYSVGRDELGLCAAWLRQEILRVQPQLVVCMGRHAAYGVLHCTTPLGQLRGQPHRMALPPEEAGSLGVLADVPVVVTYAPANLLRDPALKRQAWQDLCLACSLLTPVC